jgi:hypothetical protein
MKDDEITKSEDPKQDAKERRDFLKKVGIGGAAAIVAGGILGSSKTANAQGGEASLARKNPGRFDTKYFSQHRKPLAEAGNKFTIDLRDFKLDDQGLADVRNAMVAAAIAQVKLSGKPTPQNARQSFSTFSTFSTFSSFSSFSSFGSGSDSPGRS